MRTRIELILYFLIVTGMLQEILIKPTSMYWPASLVLIQLFNTLHDKSTSLTRTRLNIFTYVFIACFVYQVRRACRDKL